MASDLRARAVTNLVWVEVVKTILVAVTRLVVVLVPFALVMVRVEACRAQPEGSVSGSQHTENPKHRRQPVSAPRIRGDIISRSKITHSNWMHICSPCSYSCVWRS